MNKSQKLLIISNRLPVSVIKKDGKLIFTHSDGGLATGLSSAGKGMQKLWMGWPGIASDDLTSKEKRQIISELKKVNCIPIFLTDKQVNSFYFGYSNTTIWPLFHYFALYTKYPAEYWKGYQEVNKIFCHEAARYTDTNTLVWIHDYQLMLLPELLRNERPKASIGFFLHIPFPSFETFRLLPQRAAILRGLLGADLIGFHTYSYTRHFLSSVLRVLGCEINLGRVTYGDRVIRTDAFPISIDYKKFATAVKKAKAQKEIASLRKAKDQKMILSLDRLDYSKGILERLKAYDLFLEQNPKFHGKVTMQVIAIPSRVKVSAYKGLRVDIEQTVSRINGKYSTSSWAPINYRYRSIPFEQLVALYYQADVALVTPLRDGMNLVAKEYVAASQSGRGVLILSEMAGAASELTEALQVNPNNKEQVATAIQRALTMPVDEQKIRMRSLQHRVSNYDIKKWTNDFLEQLKVVKKDQQQQLDKKLTTQHKKQLINAYKKSKASLILLDYDGTLIDFAPEPHHRLAFPTKQMKEILGKLKKSNDDEIVIVSGRSKETLQAWFGRLPVSLVAEHGGWVKQGPNWLQQKELLKNWKDNLRPILQRYVDRTVNSLLEEKDFSLVWHYRNVSHSLAGIRKAELRNDILAAIKNTDIGLFEGSKIFEVKPLHIQKGIFTQANAERKKWDFILAIGDDYTDEDMFKALPKSAYTIKVGLGETAAKYFLASSEDVLGLLNQMTSK